MIPGAGQVAAPDPAGAGHSAAPVHIVFTSPPAIKVSSMLVRARRVSRRTVSFVGVVFFIRGQ